jgi:hypothetical protein
MENLKENLVWLNKLIKDQNVKIINRSEDGLRYYKFGGFYNSYEVSCLTENDEITSFFRIGYEDPNGKIIYNSVKELYQDLVLGLKVGELRANPKHYTL